MRIIIWGVANILLRRKIESFLDDDIQVIGYTDGRYHKDVIDNRSFFESDELSSLQFDKLIIAAEKETTIRQIMKRAADCGISKDRIVVPVLFDRYPDGHHWYNPIEDMVTYSKKYGLSVKTLLMGDCSAFWNFDDKLMQEGSYYKLTSTSGDIYYSWLLYKEQKKRELFPNVNKVIFSAGYRIFGVDMCKSSIPWETDDMLTWLELNDYRTAFDSDGEISNYLNNYLIWGRKLKEYYHVPRSYELKPALNMHFARNTYNNPEGWNEYKNTVEENVEIMNRIIADCAQSDIELVCVVPPFFLGNVDNGIRNKNVSEVKDFYYAQLDNRAGVVIRDYFELFNDRESFFDDNIHLNYIGAEYFTRFVLDNTDVLR